jgi:hypothetical protein
VGTADVRDLRRRIVGAEASRPSAPGDAAPSGSPCRRWTGCSRFAGNPFSRYASSRLGRSDRALLVVLYVFSFLTLPAVEKAFHKRAVKLGWIDK